MIKYKYKYTNTNTNTHTQIQIQIQIDALTNRYDKAERYNQADLERVQRIPKKEEEGGEGEAKVNFT